MPPLRLPQVHDSVEVIVPIPLNKNNTNIKVISGTAPDLIPKGTKGSIDSIGTDTVKITLGSLKIECKKAVLGIVFKNHSAK